MLQNARAAAFTVSELLRKNQPYTHRLGLSKVQQSYCYTQLCNYKEEFVFKLISDQLNILEGLNLSFTRPLNASYLEMDG